MQGVTAGHVLGKSVLGSIRFSALELDVPVILIVGHTSCGAVTDATRILDTGEVPATT
ncbi:carbonic anhydrase [Brevibacterium oceani]|uniref:carbonic anhydrase n=1 Tax=Brevibacterium oceani TaxID=358099 RepID=UPI001B31CA0E